MRLVRIPPVDAVWDVLAVADEEGRSVWDELLCADRSDSGAEQMRVALREFVPRNGPPQGRTRCRNLGDGIYEFKEHGLRVLWFYDAGEPVVRRRIICTNSCPKLNKKKFQQEKDKAVRIREAYFAAKAAGKLQPPERVKG